MPKGEMQHINCPSCGAESGAQHARECSASAATKQIPRGIERMIEEGVDGTRFDEFLADHVRSLATLPDPHRDEDAYGKAWDELVERLENASAEELVAYVWEIITRAIETQQYTEARNPASFAGMHDAVKRINQAWLDNLYKRWQSANERSKRQEICSEFDTSGLSDIQDDPRVKEIKGWRAVDEIRESYRFKRKVKSREAFFDAVAVIRRFKINLRELDSELFDQVHVDAMRQVETLSSIKDEWPLREGYNARLARGLIDEYLKLGIFDFEQDEAFIDRYTKTQ